MHRSYSKGTGNIVFIVKYLFSSLYYPICLLSCGSYCGISQQEFRSVIIRVLCRVAASPTLQEIVTETRRLFIWNAYARKFIMRQSGVSTPSAKSQKQPSSKWNPSTQIVVLCKFKQSVCWTMVSSWHLLDAGAAPRRAAAPPRRAADMTKLCRLPNLCVSFSICFF